MSTTATLSQSTAPAGGAAEDCYPWDIESAPSVIENDTWMLSFIDILTLLLALFVLLLAQEHQRNRMADNDISEQQTRVFAAPVLPTPVPVPTPTLTPALRPFSTIQLPALPQIVTPLDTLQIPAPARKQTAVEPGEIPSVTTEPVEPAAALQEMQLEADANEAPAPQPVVEATVHTPVHDLLETLRTSGLADRINIQTLTDSVRLDIADSILFAPARTTLTEGGLALLRDLAATLTTLPWSLSVEGHTDNVPIQTPRFPSNWELSTARATAVARELIRHDIRPDRIRAIGYADTQPLDTNTTADGRNRNRRVTFVLEVPASTDTR